MECCWGHDRAEHDRTPLNICIKQKYYWNRRIWWESNIETIGLIRTFNPEEVEELWKFSKNNVGTEVVFLQVLNKNSLHRCLHRRCKCLQVKCGVGRPRCGRSGRDFVWCQLTLVIIVNTGEDCQLHSCAAIVSFPISLVMSVHSLDLWKTQPHSHFQQPMVLSNTTLAGPAVLWRSPFHLAGSPGRSAGISISKVLRISESTPRNLQKFRQIYKVCKISKIHKKCKISYVYNVC